MFVILFSIHFHTPNVQPFKHSLEQAAEEEPGGCVSDLSGAAINARFSRSPHCSKSDSSDDSVTPSGVTRILQGVGWCGAETRFSFCPWM